VSLGSLYRGLAALTPEQRALYARLVAADSPAAEVVPRLGSGEPVEAAPVQQRLWFLDQIEPGNPFYNLPLLCFRLRGPLRVDRLERALREIERRHESLRTSFRERDGVPYLEVSPPSGRPLAVVDLAALPAADREAHALALARLESRRPFELARGPLWRYGLLRLGPEDHLLLVSMHHIVSDAWSLGVLNRELAALYNGAPLPPLPPLPVQYGDFAAWQRQRLSGASLASLAVFWRGHLAGAPERLELPADRPRPPARTYRGTRLGLTLPTELPGAVDALCQATGASLFMILLAAWASLLHRYTHQEDMVLGFPVAGRPTAGLESLIGFFVNTVPVRVRPSPELPFRALAARVKESVLEAYEHQDLPFDRIVEDLQPRRDASYSPLVQVMLSLQNTPTPDLRLDGLRATPMRVDNGTCQTDMILFAGLRDRRLGILQVEHNTDLFDAATIERLGGHLLALLAGAAAEPDAALGDLPFLSPAERHQLMVERAASSFDADGCLHERFFRQAALRPDAVAVVCGEESLTYGELERRARRLALSLRAQGVGPEARVVLRMERSADMVAAILGVLAAGGAYVPVEPDIPAERLAFLIADSGAAALLTRLDELPDGDGPLPDVDLDNLAYVIYTSGSTGEPKGALVTHRNATRLFDALEPVFTPGPDDVWSLFHSFAFDFSVWELWGALLHGGRVVIVPRDTIRDPAAFRDLLRDERVTVLSQTPSAFGQTLTALEDEPLPDLRFVVFGGEALDPASLRPWNGRRGRLMNLYGITETTVHVTCREVAPGDLRPTVGAPIADLSLRVLGPGLRPVPLGVPGEICVGGAGLCRGYLGRSDLTAERFVPDPFSQEPGGRLYRSGDLGRLLPDLDLEYLGRIDRQVKLRGLRIEPGEIEAAFRRQPGIREAVVELRGDRLDRLVAWYVPDGEPPTPAGLRQALRATLPEYMVPAWFVPMERFPLTVNGKIDRKSLPEPGAGRPEPERAWVAPRTPAEEALAGLWRELLGLERVGADDDFFELGGHSLLATRLVARLRDRLGIEISPRAVFETPTLAALALAVEQAGVSPAVPPIIATARAARQVRGVRA
jgi:amino acid adenylation domain-containing protein